MSDSDRNIQRLDNQNKLLRSEIESIKGSRAYKLAKTAATLKGDLKRNPKRMLKKIAKMVITKPGNIANIVMGKSLGTNLADVVDNRITDYHSWIIMNEPVATDLEAQMVESQNMNDKPLISIITPVFDPPCDALEALIESVLAQTYPFFELCLGNFGKDEAVKELIQKYASSDARIKLFVFERNEGIAKNSDMLLEKAKGEFVALLDHDDTISPDALYENAKVINELGADFIYSDKDMIDAVGNRYDPLFKPDWSPEVMLSANYLTHLNVMRTDLVKKVGGWDKETEGAQDWDLFLKVTSVSEVIHHIPKVLYHWRVIPTSTAYSIDTKPYALAGQRRAVQKHLDSFKIPATTRHQETELLLNWTDSKSHEPVLIIIDADNLSSALRAIAQLRRKMASYNADYVVVMDRAFVGSAGSASDLLVGHKAKLFLFDKGSKAKTLNDALGGISGASILLYFDAKIRLASDWSFKSLAGWLSIDGVLAAGGKIIGNNNRILDVGGLLTRSGVKPLFRGYSPYYQGYVGCVEWVRNLRVVSRQMFVADAKAIHFDESATDSDVVTSTMIDLSLKGRLVLYPKSVGFIGVDTGASFDGAIVDKSNAVLDKLGLEFDRFGNINLSQLDPMCLRGVERNVVDGGVNINDTVDGMNEYQRDALALSRLCDLTEDDIEYNIRLGNENNNIVNPKTVGWFMPGFSAIYAGLNNIFKFAEFLSLEGAAITFYIMNGDAGVRTEEDAVRAAYPLLRKAKFVSIDSNNLSGIPDMDLGICTQWASAYPLAKLRNVKRKCYFIQDCEYNFYPQGSISALVELTYKLNFFAIANTEGLLNIYKKRFGGRGVVLKSVVDLSKYHPRENVHYVPKEPYKVFFYARPNMPRNAFEIGLAGLAKLKEQMGDEVEVIMAGAALDAQKMGINFPVTNLQKIPYDNVPRLYRKIDAGLMFMFSGHPGVTASELMASGCPVVVNEYDDVTWKELYKNGVTCLTTAPTASEIARNLKRCLEDGKLRTKLIDGGLSVVEEFYSNYDGSCQATLSAILSSKPSK